MKDTFRMNAILVIVVSTLCQGRQDSCSDQIESETRVEHSCGLAGLRIRTVRGSSAASSDFSEVTMSTAWRLNGRSSPVSVLRVSRKCGFTPTSSSWRASFGGATAFGGAGELAFRARSIRTRDAAVCGLCAASPVPGRHSVRSHHLAGAVYIARRIGKAVPIQARLLVSAFNAAAWRRLTEDYQVFLQAPQARGWSRHAVTELLGACFVAEIPPVVGEGKLFLIPRRDAAAGDVSAVITSRGDIDVTEHFMALVRAQDAALAAVCERWPHLGPELAELTASCSAIANV